MGIRLCCCTSSHHTAPKIKTSTELLADAGFYVDRWLSRGRVAKVRQKNVTFVCRISNTTLANAEQDVLHRLAECTNIPVPVDTPSLPTCVFYRYIGGVDLHHTINAKLVPESAVKLQLKIIARALAFCHARGIAHMDVKPENIVIRHDGTPILIDWECALVVSDKFAMVNVSPKRGTLRYMAPEMASKTHLAGCPSDVWSFTKMYNVCVGSTLTVSENPSHRPTMKSLLLHPSVK